MITITKSEAPGNTKFSVIKAKLAAKLQDGNVTKTKRYGHARPRLPRIPIDMPGHYGTGEVLSVTGWSPAKLFSKIRDGSFPPPSKDGNRNIWKTSVLREHLGL